MSYPTEGLRIRPAVRALLLTPDDEVLLVRFEFPGGRTRWALPGGGVEEGESDVAALERELDEEVGLVGAEIGPHVWTRLHVVPFVSGLWDGQRDHIHLVPCTRFEPAPRLGWDTLRAEYLYEIRWWAVSELATAGLPLAPADLVERIGDLRRDGPPAEPIRVAV
jgi:8-oxo-dGTP pyrophosphatase MutT (NUDIX family)